MNDLAEDDDAKETMRLLEAAGADAAFFATDVTDSAAVDEMVAHFVAKFGRIDILVNNPYRWEEGHFLEISEADWDSTMAVCLKSFFLCSQSAARAMVAQGDGGSIVSTSSVHAKRCWPGDTTYGIAKAGILRAHPPPAFSWPSRLRPWLRSGQPLDLQRPPAVRRAHAVDGRGPRTV